VEGSSAPAVEGGANAGAGGEEDDFEDGADLDLLQDPLSDDEDVEGGPNYDTLLECLRKQLQAVHGEQLVGRLTDTQVISKASGLSGADELKEGVDNDKRRVLQLLEATRRAEKAAAGKRRNKSAARKRQLADKKLDKDYIKTEMKNAYSAQTNQGVRFFNSLAIRVHKGEKAVDVKLIDQAQAVQEGKELQKASKEDRMMERRLA